MDRRTFLKITGMGSVALAGGCTSNPEKNLYSLVSAPDDMVTGKAAWYATTCRECPAGCGVLAKNREGRVIKLEGNPLHPVNQGKLCARGQAALQGLYNPDRLTTPLRKTDKGWQAIDFEAAQALVRERFVQAAAKGANRIAMLSEVVGESLLSLLTQTLAHHNAAAPLVFEPLAFESLKFAHHRLFGQSILPGYRMEQADVLVSFGADFLETWLSPVAYARKFKRMHALDGSRKGAFFHISPYQSLTAANADQWLACRPGREVVAVLGLIHRVLQKGRGSALPKPFYTSLARLTYQYPLARVATLTGIAESDLEKLSSRLATAQRPLVLGACTAANGASAVGVDLAALLLNAVLDPSFALYDFARRHRVETAGTRREMTQFIQNLTDEPVELLLLNNVNPLYSLPAGTGAAKALAAESLFVVAFSNFMDDTAAAADLIFPVQLPLERWDIYESRQNLKATLQPCVGKISKAPHVGDCFLNLLPADQRPAHDYRGYLIRQMGLADDHQWLQMVQKGGHFDASETMAPPDEPAYQSAVAALGAVVGQVAAQPPLKQPLYLVPSIRHFDGRGANRPWLSEIPDPLSLVAWQSTAWVHPEAMQANGWRDGEVIRLTTAEGEVQVPVQACAGLHPTAVMMALGLGHVAYGRYARGQGVNPVVLMGAGVDQNAGAPNYETDIIKMESLARTEPLAMVSGSRSQYGRKIALSVPIEKAHQHAEKGHGLTMEDFPLTLPLPEGYDPHRDIYAPHDHVIYRWGMVVDLDRCIGCSACVAACYAENNIGVVGQQQVVQGREMAWLRIERYQNPDRAGQSIFLPMMCQHCDNAPCEAVCPVYAPHHSKEGINNQIYNRCIGTRFCAQNCPYKVRRFNWFDWSWPDPLPMQLNPNVTVRSKGVMEKCSFCIHRIKTAHGEAKNKERAILDGEVVPACVQTCPTDALHFGNMMDPNSRVRELTADPRAYQVMGYLNTKPAVIYLKKVTQTI
jgi:anaerobic selenocysteine-containing dehydrogenase/Fe-S-cluster-containing dehydrogenase component